MDITREVNSKYNNIAWGAIFAGTIVSLGIETLLNFLGLGLGLASLNPQNPQMFNLESGITLWLAVSGMLSMGIGGWFTGRFSNISCVFNRGCHGVVVWSLATFITVIAATTTSKGLMSGTISIAIDYMSRASIVLFITFFVSALASIVGAIWAGAYKKNEIA